MSADSVRMPSEGTVRLQPAGYPSVFKPTGEPVSPVLRWLRNHLPRAFNPAGTWRFEDPEGRYKETYTGTSLRDAAIEVFDRYRVDGLARELAAAVRRPGGVRFSYPVGSIPRSELESKEKFIIRSDDQFADAMATQTQSWLSTRPRLVRLMERHTGAAVVDSGTVMASGHGARTITHRIGREVYNAPENWAGIRYSSRVGTGHENWMIYDRCTPSVDGPDSVAADDPDLISALSELGLSVL